MRKKPNIHREPEPGGLPPQRPLQHGGSPESLIDAVVEDSLLEGILAAATPGRRALLRTLGRGALLGFVASTLPLAACKTPSSKSCRRRTKPGPRPARTRSRRPIFKVGFVPITCATPIIMAQPMGFYQRYGLNVEVIKTAGWAVARDKSLNREYDAAHMLSPMPLAISLGLGSSPVPFSMAAVENVNGQAITLRNDHKDKRDPRKWKGFKLAVPFEYSMHNFLLRYYLAEHGLDPDKDVQIRVIPPPEMVANLEAGNVDGYLAPDPFNQRAVFEQVGFIHLLSKEIWDGHPCCAFAASQTFAETMPNTFAALFRSIVDATYFASKPENRKDIAKAISAKNYLNQPETVVEQVLTGRYADGLGEVREVPDRIDFRPFPWHSMAVWILTQMKRWGYLKGEIDYKQIAHADRNPGRADPRLVTLGADGGDDHP